MLAMDECSVVAPPYLGRPLRLHAFRGTTLAPRRMGWPGVARALTRAYRDADAELAALDRAGHLVTDEEPALYLHEYSAGGLTVRGLVGALDLARRAATQAESAVVPHEGIHPERVEALAERMVALHLQPAPILLVHRGPEPVRRLLQRTVRTPPDRVFTDRGRQHHRIWALRAPADLELLDRELAGAVPMIADGHHRYAAYLGLQQSRPGTGWDHGLAMLVDQSDTPLFLGAIHRVLHGITLDQVAEVAVAHGWALPLLARRQALDALSASTAVLTDGSRWAVLPLHLPPGETAVDVLHDLVLPALPGGVPDLAHVHDVETAIRQARRRGGVAVLLPAPDFDLIHHLVAHQRLLPEKATSFQPKPGVGVLMRAVPDG